MTNVATKDGAVIVKDGSVAEGCGCCVGNCGDCKPTQLSVTISANDFLRHREFVFDGGGRHKESWGIIASPVSGTFSLSLVSDSSSGNTYERFYESQSISYPGSGKVEARFFNSPGFFPGGVTGQLFTMRIPITVCYAFTTQYYSGYKFYTLEEMLTPESVSSGGATVVLVRHATGVLSTTFACTSQAGAVRTYLAIGGPNVFDGVSTDAQEGASIPCSVWSYDPTTTSVVTASGGQQYGGIRRYDDTLSAQAPTTTLSSSDVVTGGNVVSIESMEFDCGE